MCHNSFSLLYFLTQKNKLKIQRFDFQAIFPGNCCITCKSHRKICTPEKRFQILRFIWSDFPSALRQINLPFKPTL